MAVDAKVRVELSFLKTYVHPDGTVFRAGEVYETSLAKAEELLSQRNDEGMPYFRRWKSRVPRAPQVQNEDGLEQGLVQLADTPLSEDKVRTVRGRRPSDRLGPEGDTGAAALRGETDDDGVTV